MQLQPISELSQTQPKIPVSRSSPTLVGRSAPAPGKLPTAWVQASGKHCQISWDSKADAWSIKDTSTNGTFVNGERVPKNGVLPLVAGDVVRLSHPQGHELGKLLEYRFEEESPSSAGSPAPAPAPALDCGAKRTAEHPAQGAVESPDKRPRQALGSSPSAAAPAPPHQLELIGKLQKTNEELRAQVAEQRQRGDEQEAALGQAHDVAAKQALSSTTTIALLKEQAGKEKEAHEEALRSLLDQVEASGKLAETSLKAAADAKTLATEQAFLLTAESAIAEGLRSSLNAAEAKITKAETELAAAEAAAEVLRAELAAAASGLATANTSAEVATAAREEAEGQLAAEKLALAATLKNLAAQSATSKDGSGALLAAKAEAAVAAAACKTAEQLAAQLERDLGALRDREAAAQEQLSVKESMLASLAHDASGAVAAFQSAMQELPTVQALLDTMRAAAHSHQTLADTARYASDAGVGECESKGPTPSGTAEHTTNLASPVDGDAQATQAVASVQWSPNKSVAPQSTSKRSFPPLPELPSFITSDAAGQSLKSGGEVATTINGCGSGGNGGGGKSTPPPAAHNDETQMSPPEEGGPASLHHDALVDEESLEEESPEEETPKGESLEGEYADEDALLPGSQPATAAGATGGGDEHEEGKLPASQPGIETGVAEVGNAGVAHEGGTVRLDSSDNSEGGGEPSDADEEGGDAMEVEGAAQGPEGKQGTGDQLQPVGSAGLGTTGKGSDAGDEDMEGEKGPGLEMVEGEEGEGKGGEGEEEGFEMVDADGEGEEGEGEEEGLEMVDAEGGGEEGEGEEEGLEMVDAEGKRED